MQNIILSVGAASAGLSVILGAFAAHGLRDQLSEKLLATFQTGVTYQFYHSLALLLVGLLMKQWAATVSLRYIALLFMAGMLMFSGSLYVLAMGGPRWLGPITPLGGTCFIIAWFWLAAVLYKVQA